MPIHPWSEGGESDLNLDDESDDVVEAEEAMQREGDTADTVSTSGTTTTNQARRPSRQEYANYKRVFRLPETEDADIGTVHGTAKQETADVMRIIRHVFPLRRAEPLGQNEAETGSGASGAVVASTIEAALRLVLGMVEQGTADKAYRVHLVDWKAFEAAAKLTPPFKGHPKLYAAMRTLDTRLLAAAGTSPISNNVFQHRLNVVNAAKKRAAQLDAGEALLEPEPTVRKKRRDAKSVGPAAVAAATRGRKAKSTK